MGQALYRRYRSKSLTEIIGQEHITDTLKTAVEQGRISHAYLFSGPRGVGKTSIARILAHEINELPYIDDSTHMDIIEIDAASNRRIDEIRDIREKVYMAPTSSKYKIYIIDEVHMLTREAFNALLKTLEEPPAHAVFILATTEANKLPETIISRTQHFTFKPVSQEKVVAHLQHIADAEGIKVSPDALGLLAAHGGGSFRDSISLLDQAGGMTTEITLEDVRRLLGIAPEEAISALLESLRGASLASNIINQLCDLYGQGLQAASIARQLSSKLRDGLTIDSPPLPLGNTLQLLRNLTTIPASPNPERLLEITMIEAAESIHIQGFAVPPEPVAQTVVVEPVSKTPSMSENIKILSPASHKTEVANMQDSDAQEPQPAKKPQKPSAIEVQPATPTTPKMPTKTEEIEPLAIETIQTTVAPNTGGKQMDESVWAEILAGLKKEYNTLYGVLRNAKPIFGKDDIELQLKFAFHQKRLSESKNRQIIAGFIKEATGRDMLVRCTVAAQKQISGQTAGTAPSKPAIDSVTNIFGGGEVLST